MVYLQKTYPELFDRRIIQKISLLKDKRLQRKESFNRESKDLFEQPADEMRKKIEEEFEDLVYDFKLLLENCEHVGKKMLKVPSVLDTSQKLEDFYKAYQEQVICDFSHFSSADFSDSKRTQMNLACL